MVITDADKPTTLPIQQPPGSASGMAIAQNTAMFQEQKPNYNAYGPGAEAKIRLTEGRNTTLGKNHNDDSLK